MPEIKAIRRVRHSADQMYALVADVEKYPQFVPMCEGLRLRGRQEMPDGRTIVIADMTAGYGAIRETFTSRATLDPAARTILVEYLHGPFKSLENTWKFRDLPEGGSEVDFFIAYEFKSRILSALMGSIFDKAFRKLTAAFEDRADKIYRT